MTNYKFSFSSKSRELWEGKKINWRGAKGKGEFGFSEI